MNFYINHYEFESLDKYLENQFLIFAIYIVP